MKRKRLAIAKFGCCFWMLFILSCTNTNNADLATQKPNFIWIVSEDNSASYLDLYSEHGAAMPALSRLAAHGITFKHAYSNAPVCSVARTTLQTGIHAPQLGTHYHRPFKKVTLPNDIKLVHEYLKADGYFVSNNSKTDYNIETDKSKGWHQSSKQASWQNRTDDAQPFFHMQSPNTTHEGKLHFDHVQLNENVLGLDYSKEKLPKYFPDTDTFRYTQRYYKHLNERLDNEIDALVKALDADGVLEDTFIFYFSDHGGVLPRGKGYVYNSGLHVPLVVRVPENFKHLVNGINQQSVNGAVEFVDFAPTLLNLAGISIPKHMSGKPFLGPDVDIKELQSRNESFGYADRLGAKYNFTRSITIGDYHYVRSYQPNIPDGLHNEYRYRMLAYQELRELYKKGELNTYQRQFFEARPAELLFDLGSDPDEVVNLASDPTYQDKLVELRTALNQRVKSLPDLGFLPESYFAQNDLSATLKYGEQNVQKIIEYIDIANLQYQDFEIAAPKISEALNSQDPIRVFWGLTASLAFDSLNQSLKDQILALAIAEKPSYVIARYSEVLGKFHLKNPQPLLAMTINQTSDTIAATELFNAVVYLHDFTAYKADITAIKPIIKHAFDVDIRMAYLKGEVP